MNMEFQYFVPVHIVSGENCVRKNGGLMKSFGGQALIVTGQSSAKTGLWRMLFCFESKRPVLCRV